MEKNSGNTKAATTALSTPQSSFPGFAWANRAVELVFSQRAADIEGTCVTEKDYGHEKEYPDISPRMLVNNDQQCQWSAHVDKPEHGFTYIFKRMPASGIVAEQVKTYWENRPEWHHSQAHKKRAPGDKKQKEKREEKA